MGEKVRLKKKFIYWFSKRYPKNNIPSYAKKYIEHCINKTSFFIFYIQEDYYGIENINKNIQIYVHKKFLTKRGPFK